MMDELIDRLRRGSRSIYLMIESGAADEVSKLLGQAADELQSLREENEKVREEKRQRRDAAEKWTMDDKYDY